MLFLILEVLMMRLLMLISALILLNGCGFNESVMLRHSQWQLAMGNELGTKIYTDSSTIRRRGDLAKMWSLFDSETTQELQGKRYLSFQQHSEYDCVEERTRILSATFFSGHMGNGDVVSTAGKTEWYTVGPGSVNQWLWKIACPMTYRKENR
jgi:hypothetical protein